MPLSANKIYAHEAGYASHNFKKSIMWGTLNVPGTILEKCAAVKEAGYQGIEPNSHMNRQEIIDAVKATGLEVSSVCCALHWSKPLSHPDPAIRQEGIEGVILAMEDAKAYGTDAILLVPGIVNENSHYDDCWNRSIECIKKIVPVAENLKVNICIENVWNKFIMSPMEAIHYMDQCNSEYVKFYLDCGNLLMYGWPEQWIKILGNRLGRIHIKEFSREIAEVEGRRAGFRKPLTEGSVNWEKVMQAARQYYQNVWLTTEIDSGNTIETLKDLSARFDKILT